MNSNRVVQIVSLFLAAALLTVALFIRPLINKERVELKLVNEQVTSDLPPGAMMTSVLLSTFRGVAIDILWHRANQLKEQGKFYEAYTLSEAITTLQPRFTQAWVFHSWNMAFNISVATNTEAERWSWVRKGIELLREKGIPANPRAVRLYKELGWTFYFKVGQFSDDKNWYYKRRLALEWQEILGTPNDGAKKDEVIARFKLVADAASTQEELYQISPKSRALVDEFLKLGYKLDERLLRTIGRIMIINLSPDARFMGVNASMLTDPAERRVAEILADPELAQGGPALMAHLRKRVIIDRYRMDPAYMLELMQEFGPLDWRSANAHACYWAALGVKMADDRTERKKDTDRINTYRGTIHALQDMMYRGRIAYDPLSDRIDLLPDIRFIPAYEKAMELGQEYADRSSLSKGVDETYQTGHENFLIAATVYSWLYGDDDQAKFYYEKVQKLYGKKPHNASGRFLVPLSEFVQTEISKNYDVTNYSRQFIDAMIVRGLEQGLANNQPGIFMKFIEIAKGAHDKWVKMKTATGKTFAEERLTPNSFDEVLSGSYVGYMRMPQVPFVLRARIWNSTPEALQLKSYDRLFPTLEADAKANNKDVAVPYPAPAGIEEYRKQHPVVMERPGEPDTGPARIERK